MIHVLTAVTRPQNLPKLARSLAEATKGRPLTWHWRFDVEGRHIGGQEPKNRMLDAISDGWVWVLDDDTLVHPDLFDRLEGLDVDALVVSQRRRDGSTLRAARENVATKSIDIGQVVLRRSLIGDTRIHESYIGDGLFLTEVLRDANVCFLDEPLSFHNALEKRSRLAGLRARIAQ